MATLHNYFQRIIFTKNHTEGASVAPNDMNRINIIDPRNDPYGAHGNVCEGIVHAHQLHLRTIIPNSE